MSDKTDVGHTRQAGMPRVWPESDMFDRFFRAFGDPMRMLPATDARTWPSLQLDVSETDEGITVTAELPGVEASDIDVTLEGEVLRIRAEKRSEETRGDETWHIRERSHGTVERRLRVPRGIDPDAIKADFTGGLLTLRLPPARADAESGHKIAVSSG